MKKMIKRNDWLLIGALLIICVALLAVQATGSRSATTVEVYVGNERVFTAAYGEAEEYDWREGDAYVMIVSDDQGARIADSSCPDKLCVRQGNIRRGGESVVCLPNRVCVRLSSSEAELDAVLR